MTAYDVLDQTTGESHVFYAVTPAKKWMRERMRLGHDVTGSKTKIYANGDWIPCGEINLNGSNKVFIANSGMTTSNY